MELPIQFQQLSTKPTSHSFAHLLDPPTKLTIPNSPHQTNEFGKSSPTTPISSNAFLLNGSLEDKHRIQILEEQIRLLAGESSKAVDHIVELENELAEYRNANLNNRVSSNINNNHTNNGQWPVSMTSEKKQLRRQTVVMVDSGSTQKLLVNRKSRAKLPDPTDSSSFKSSDDDGNNTKSQPKDRPAMPQIPFEYLNESLYRQTDREPPSPSTDEEGSTDIPSLFETSSRHSSESFSSLSSISSSLPSMIGHCERLQEELQQQQQQQQQQQRSSFSSTYTLLPPSPVTNIRSTLSSSPSLLSLQLDPETTSIKSATHSSSSRSTQYQDSTATTESSSSSSSSHSISTIPAASPSPLAAQLSQQQAAAFQAREQHLLDVIQGHEKREAELLESLRLRDLRLNKIEAALDAIMRARSFLRKH